MGPHIPKAKPESAARQAGRQKLPSLEADLPGAFPYRLPALTINEFPESFKNDTLAGIHRNIPVESLHAGRWEQLAKGKRIWRWAVQSAGAAGIRFRLTNFHVGAGRVWVYDASREEGETFGPYTADGLFGDGEVWTDYVMSDTAVIEYEPDASADPATIDIPFRVEKIAHMLPRALARETAGGKSKALRERAAALITAGVGANHFFASAPCNLDISCYSEWSSTAKSVGHIMYEQDDASYMCSGTLINTRNSSGLPLFLTANHCISTDAAARTVQSFWGYQTSSCNGAPANRRNALRVLGSRFLAGAGGSQGDYTLLRLTEVPAGATFAGWNANDVPEDTSLTVIHHPSGDAKRIAFGSRISSRAGADLYYRVRYSSGVTEGGSSGSGLFTREFQLNGILSSGPKADTPEGYCTISPFVDQVGKFSTVYNGLRDYFEDRNAGTPPIPPPSSLPTVLVSGVVQNLVIEPVTSPTLFNGRGSYTIQVPASATSLEVRLATSTPSADVDLFVTHGRDNVLNTGGNGATADFRSEGLAGDEVIVITPSSSPPLQAGTYYISLAMLTRDTRAVSTFRRP